MKTSFEKFIEANANLSKCFEAVPFDKYSTFTAEQKNTLCRTESDAVRAFLNNGQVGFANMIKERLEAAAHKWSIPSTLFNST